MKSRMLITLAYKQEGDHKEFVPEGKTVSSELIILTNTGKKVNGADSERKAVGPFCKTIPLLRGIEIFQKCRINIKCLGSRSVTRSKL